MMDYQTYYPGLPCYPMAGPMAQYRQPAAPAPIPPQPAAVQPAPMLTDDRLWVQGEGAATSWPVTANGFVRLWDSTAPVFYEKRADAQGKPLPLEIYDYKRREGEPSAFVSGSGYEARLKSIEERLSAMEQKQKEEEGQ